MANSSYRITGDPSLAVAQWKIERLQLMLEAALEGQEAALASQGILCDYIELSTLARRREVASRHRAVIKTARAAVERTREAALSLRRG